MPVADPNHHYHFVTGKLAEASVRSIATAIGERFGCAISVGVMPITVAALITPKWLMRHLSPPPNATDVVLPGYIVDAADGAPDSAMLRSIATACGCRVWVGPKDCRDLPQWFGGDAIPPDLSRSDIEIIAEINHVPRLSVAAFVDQAISLRDQGADRIDVGCDPQQRCQRIGDYVRAAVDRGLTVSIDTFDAWEAAAAVDAGASLVLSVNSTNRDLAPEWGCEVVAIPDTPGDLRSLDDTIAMLREHDVRCRVDAILEPIGAGLLASLQRYADVRSRYPDVAMMMGIGNVTELTDVDSAGVNFLLLGICQELRIQSVLTTQVINWARSSVRECDVARRLVKHAIDHGVPPKRISGDLVMLRDPKLKPHAAGVIADLAGAIRDNNYRLFAQDDLIQLVSAGLHLSSDDPFELFDQLLSQPEGSRLDAGHAFYLGFEMAKASIALQLGKQYEQDQSLNWGLLTRPEDHHRIARTTRKRSSGS